MRAALIAERDGQPVEQFRMRRLRAHVSEVVGRIDDPRAEVVLPHAIDDGPPRQHVVRRGDPVRQRRAARAFRRRRRQRRTARAASAHRRARPARPACRALSTLPRCNTVIGRGSMANVNVPCGSKKLAAA